MSGVTPARLSKKAGRALGGTSMSSVPARFPSWQSVAGDEPFFPKLLVFMVFIPAAEPRPPQCWSDRCAHPWITGQVWGHLCLTVAGLGRHPLRGNSDRHTSLDMVKSSPLNGEGTHSPCTLLLGDHNPHITHWLHLNCYLL